MKKKYLLAILVCASLAFTQCKKEDNSDPLKKEETKPSLKDFSLSQNNVSLTKETEQKIEITSGNNEYTFEQSEEDKKIAQVSLSSDKKEVVIKALTEGKISIKITDVPSKKEISLVIFVFSKVTPQDYELSQDKKTLIKWKGAHTKSLDMNAIEALKGVTNIGEEAFSGNKNIEQIILPKGLTSLADQVFMDCINLKTVSIPDTVISIGRGAFGDCTNLEEVELPKGLTEIKDTFFYGCKSLTKITIPESVQSVGYNAFEQTLIKEIIFPTALKTLDTDVVAWCEKLEKIVFKGTTPPTIDYSSLKRKVENPPLKIYVPKGKKQTYINSSEEWKDLEELIVESNS